MFVDTCAKQGVVIDLETAERVVKVYRKKYARVKNLWRDTNDAAIEAVRTHKPVRVARVTFFTRGDFLHCRLPSGRLLSYFKPHIRKKKTPWGTTQDELNFWGVDDKGRWLPMSTYGGKLVENIVQAIARDLMAEAMLRAEYSSTYDLIMSVHDELVCEVDEDKGDVKAFELMMSELPEWAYGCPVTAEGWRGKRYKK